MPHQSLQAPSESQSDMQVAVLRASQNLSSSKPRLIGEDNPDSSSRMNLPKATQNEYCVQFEDNNCKKWDGKKVWLDGEWLEELYQPPQLSPGSKICLPWPGKGGHIKQWNATVIDPVLDSTISPTIIKQPKKGQGTALKILMYKNIMINMQHNNYFHLPLVYRREQRKRKNDNKEKTRYSIIMS